jgi:CelD/BcsL family acetyltransferase involved in cellulose biosynthesis
VTVVRVSRDTDFAALGARWRDLERRAAASFFQSWTWVGCLAAERFDDPVLVEATEGGRTVALALFNRVRRWIGPSVLHLGASGSAERDSPYVEQNGVLAEADRVDELTLLCLGAVASRYDLVLPGVDETVLQAARRAAGLVRAGNVQASPFVDLGGVRAIGGDYLAGCSANTRQQIRRSDRLYERDGSIEVERAHAVDRAQAMLEEMAVLHQAAWQARGQPGCFVRPFFRRFHRALITAAVPRGEVALFRLSSAGAVIGILHNFTHGGRMLAYQSGFAYRADEKRAKPGLTCHRRVIEVALGEGLDRYDFLAGNDRYKRSLADAAHQQIWAVAGPLWSPRMLLRTGLDRVR